MTRRGLDDAYLRLQSLDQVAIQQRLKEGKEAARSAVLAAAAAMLAAAHAANAAARLMDGEAARVMGEEAVDLAARAQALNDQAERGNAA